MSNGVNIVLIGMPGAGKSTIGVVLAKSLSKGFVDTDVLIQTELGMSLQTILDTRGYMELRRIEEEILMKLDCGNHVIATGGSAAYSEPAMNHLKSGGVMVFLRVPFEEIVRRVSDYETRGIARSPGQSFQGLFEERQRLYEKFADISIDCGTSKHDAVLAMLSDALDGFGVDRGINCQ